MGLTEQEINELKEAFTTCTRPVILFDDDQDGLCSFLMIYKHVKDGKGIPVKNAPEVGVEFAEKVNDFSPDLIIILDMPLVTQEFLDSVHAKVVWLDHHPLQNNKNVKYYNPRRHDPSDNRPTSYWVYKALGDYLWIAMAGTVGDWHMPEDAIREEFIKKYPDLLPSDMTKPEAAIHDSKLGELIRVMLFNMKGKTTDVMKSVKVFTRIKTPYEILNQETPAGKYLYKKFQTLDKEFQSIMQQVQVNAKDKVLLFTYAGSTTSFSKEVSNALTYKYPDKLVIIAWEYGGEYKCSLRSAVHNIPKLLDKALHGISGYGGGHDHACGACIKKEHFEQFVKNLRKQVE